MMPMSSTSMTTIFGCNGAAPATAPSQLERIAAKKVVLTLQFMMQCMA